MLWLAKIQEKMHYAPALYVCMPHGAVRVGCVLGEGAPSVWTPNCIGSRKANHNFSPNLGWQLHKRHYANPVSSPIFMPNLQWQLHKCRYANSVSSLFIRLVEQNWGKLKQKTVLNFFSVTFNLHRPAQIT